MTWIYILHALLWCFDPSDIPGPWFSFFMAIWLFSVHFHFYLRVYIGNTKARSLNRGGPLVKWISRWYQFSTVRHGVLPVVAWASSALPGTEEMLNKYFSYERCLFSCPPHLLLSMPSSLFGGFSSLSVTCLVDLPLCSSYRCACPVGLVTGLGHSCVIIGSVLMYN